MGSSTRTGISRTIQLTIEDEANFWARVNKHDEGGCWLWTGYVDRHGYGQFNVGPDRVSARKVSWVLHHRQTLPSYKPIHGHKGCKKGCVRPTHLTRRNRGYNPSKSGKNKTFTVLHPPDYGHSDVPNQEVVHAAGNNYKELRAVNHSLRTLIAAVPSIGQETQKALAKTTTSLSSLKVELEERDKDDARWRREFDLWRARLDQRLERLERLLSASQASDRVEQAEGETGAPAPSPSEPAASEPSPMGDVLVSAFRQQMGGLEAPSGEDVRSLQIVFDLALAESDGEPAGAVTLFGEWLASFKRKAEANPDIEVSPQSFARLASGPS